MCCPKILMAHLQLKINCLEVKCSSASSFNPWPSVIHTNKSYDKILVIHAINQFFLQILIVNLRFIKNEVTATKYHCGNIIRKML